jgi:23S rRNA (uracil1939-C5)-methyltransferase
MAAQGEPRGDDRASFVVTIEGLAHGPDGVARHEGRVVFVPGVAPGDRVRVLVREERGSYVRAEAIGAVDRGLAHRDAPCPWVATCGGCAWQHVSYDAQLQAKARNVRELLVRIGGVTPRRLLPIVPAPHEWDYRHRIRLHVGPGGVVGLLRPRSHRVVEISACLIADRSLSLALEPLRGVVPRLRVRVETIDLVTNGRGGVAALLVIRDRLHDTDIAAIAGLIAPAGALAGVIVRGKGFRRVFGDPEIVVQPDPLGPPIHQQVGGFTQVNPEANRALVGTVLDWAAPARTALDLFCGSGNLTMPLARAGIRAVGVDRDADLIRDARRSAAAAGEIDVRFEVETAERFLRQQGARGMELVVLDPPRGGAAPIATQLARLRAPRILYVSCDPATLARDTRILAAGGYVVDRVQPLDLFPQTPHVETLLEAVLTAR